MLKRIAAFLEVPASELMGEAGPPLDDRMVADWSTPGAAKLLAAYIRLDGTNRAALVQLAEALYRG